MCGLIRVSNSTESTWVASPTPSKRAWLRFKRHRMGFASLVLFVVMTVLSLGAELISNDKPLLARYDGRITLPKSPTPVVHRRTTGWALTTGGAMSWPD